jgi:putative aldouronate transport system substrate-binding protein
MKPLLRIGAMTLAVAMVGTSFFGCNSKAQTSSASSNTTKTAKSYTMLMRSTYVGWINDLKWYDEAEKETGIHVNYVKGPEEFSDFYSEVDQRVISGKLPDATMTKLSQTDVYGPQGVFMNLAPEIKKYAPHLQAYIDSNPTYKSLVTNDKGAIYGLVKETPIFADFIGYRADQFKKAGIDASKVTTVDDFTNALRTLKAYYGKTNKNYYPLSGRDSAIRFAAWFGCPSSISSKASHGVYLGHYKDGSIDIMNSNAYTMVETMKTWYKEGLINPQWVSGTFSEADWESAMLNGNGSVFYDYYNRAEWFMENGGPKADTAYSMKVLDFLKGSDGKTMKVTTSTKYNDELVTAVNAKASESTVKAILSFIDFFYTDKGKTLANYGVEGQSYKKASDGSNEFIVSYSTEEAKKDGVKKWSFLSDRFTVCKPVDDTAFFKWNAPLISEAASRLLKSDNLMTSYTLKYTDTQSKDLSNLIATEYDAQTAGITAFINGSADLTPSTWAAFQKSMNDKGLSKIESIQLAAYKNTYGNK